MKERKFVARHSRMLLTSSTFRLGPNLSSRISGSHPYSIAMVAGAAAPEASPSFLFCGRFGRVTGDHNLPHLVCWPFGGKIRLTVSDACTRGDD
jgi:hypothetical protein